MIASPRHRSYYEQNRERVIDAAKAYYAANKEKRREYDAAYYAENKRQRLIRTRDRQARQQNATPAWASKVGIAAIYERAELLTLVTGVPHEVDHIIPLKGRDVCGLHVESNLQAIPAGENRIKGNRRV